MIRHICILLVFITFVCGQQFMRTAVTDVMKCTYGERGSLTATCVNATPSYFKNTMYRFDHLDETLRCENCNLQVIDTGTFDISGNQIKNLDLSASRISTIKQKAFVGLIFLQQLILSNNDIKSIYPGTFAGVKKITQVNLANNSIEFLSENGFMELINLQYLYLQHNQIRSIATNAFNGLTSLKILDLSNNAITDVKDVFNNLTALQLLDLSYNKIKDLKGNDFDNITNLLEINLAHNFIKTIPQSEFAGMFSLRKLDLSFNTLEQIIPGSFKGLSLLEDLDLSNNNINEIPQKTLMSLHSLKGLNASYNKIKIFQTGLYSGLPQLRTLNLSHNIIEDVEITGVFSLQTLHTLDFSDNNITDFDYISLISRLPQIAYLNLEDNLLPCYLENDMEKYFAEDNFKFVLYKNEVGAVKCIDNPKQKEVKEKYVMDSLKIYENQQSASTGTIWSFVLIAFMFILIGVLFFLYYRTFREVRAYSFQRSTSQSRLISSELEARDNDYLKE